MVLASLVGDELSVLACMLHHIVELTFSLQQLPRSALLLYAASFHHDHLVVVSNCVESMSDCYHSCVRELLTNDFLDEGVCLHVDVRSGLIKD
jgi:hypothetical protein